MLSIVNDREVEMSELRLMVRSTVFSFETDVAVAMTLGRCTLVSPNPAEFVSSSAP